MSISTADCKKAIESAISNDAKLLEILTDSKWFDRAGIKAITSWKRVNKYGKDTITRIFFNDVLPFKARVIEKDRQITEVKFGLIPLWYRDLETAPKPLSEEHTLIDEYPVDIWRDMWDKGYRPLNEAYDYYYDVMDGVYDSLEGHIHVMVCPKVYQKENDYWYDGEFDLDDILPEIISPDAEMEATWSTKEPNVSVEDIVKAMDSAGFTRLKLNEEDF